MDVQEVKNFLVGWGASPSLIKNVLDAKRNKYTWRRICSVMKNITSFPEEAKRDYFAFMKFMKVLLKKIDERKKRFRIDELYSYLLKLSKTCSVSSYVEDYNAGKIKDEFLDGIKSFFGKKLFDETIDSIFLFGDLLFFNYAGDVRKFNEMFSNNDAIIIDYETTLIGKEDVDAIIFSALDTKTDKVYYKIEDLIPHLHGRILVAFNIKFDLRVFTKELNKCGWYYFKSEELLASKSIQIVTYHEYKKGSDKLCFYSYGLENIFNGVNLSDISKMVMEYCKNKSNVKYSDKLMSYGKGLRVDYSESAVSYLSQKNVSYSVEENHIYLHDDVAVKSYCEFIGEDLHSSSLYKEYNLRDVYITAIAFLYSTDIFVTAIMKAGYDFMVFDRNKKYLTLASLSYAVVLDFCVEDALDKIDKGELWSLNYKVVPRDSIKLDGAVCIVPNRSYYRNRKIYVLNDDDTAYIIRFPILDREMFKSYSGGIVYYKDVVKHYSDTEYVISSYDINSAYPTAMTVLGVQPYSALYEFSPSELSKKCVVDEDSVQSNLYRIYKRGVMFRLVGYKVRNFVTETNLYVSYPDLRWLFDMALSGEVQLFCEGTLHYINPETTGFGWKVTRSDGLTVNAVGVFEQETMCNVFDLFASNALFTIKKLYVMRGGNNYLSQFIYHVYKLRCRLKKEKNSFQNTLKLFLNSAYGKFGSLLDKSNKYFYNIPRQFKSYEHIGRMIRNKKHRAIFFKMLREGLEEFTKGSLTYKLGLYDKSFDFYVFGRVVYRNYRCNYDKENKFRFREEEVRKNYSKNNFLVASAITSYARLLLSMYKSIFVKWGVEVLYCDTDSLYVRRHISFNYNSVEFLGGLKHEDDFAYFRAVAKKIYVTDSKIKCKGVRKTVIDEHGDDFRSDFESLTIDTCVFDKLGSGKVFKTVTKKISVMDTYGLVDYATIKGDIDGEK